MRIVAGKFKGRILRSPRGLEIRPTGDRLKETLFDILGARVSGAVFLDGFAGTGSIGLEALSRGAREVVFIESSDEAARLVRKNLDTIGNPPGARIIPRDIFTALRELGRQNFSSDIAFFDPPYRWEPYGDLLQLVFKTAAAGRDGLVILEHHAKAAVPGEADSFRRWRTVSQGDKRLSFYGAA
jgi:16S rRNA (guanine(966)-N(2))-methyltransferase RsmD